MQAIIIFLMLFPTIILANWKVLQEDESDDCYLSWLEDHQGNTYELKQIKDLDPSEQFLLVVDATANKIDHRLRIPVNQIEMIAASKDFPGKKIKGSLATLHKKSNRKISRRRTFLEGIYDSSTVSKTWFLDGKNGELFLILSGD